LKNTILVTGGAGYIGSQNCKSLAKNNLIPITYDNFSEGNEYAVKWGPYVNADINDLDRLDQTIKKYKPKAIMHFAANALIAESMKNPKKYYENNVIGTLNLLNVCLKNNIKYFIFSSSCAIYGQPQYTPMDEKHPKNPINTYGKSKYMVEEILKDYGRAFDLKYVSLRYFNASGADLNAEIGEDRKQETHLIPLAIDTAMGIHPYLNVFGTNFKTKDKTAIRDYIHIEDLAEAHQKALNYLLETNKSLTVNLGSEKGFSVLEVIREIETKTKTKIKIKPCPRREGDPAVLFANSSLAKKILKWKPKFSNLQTIINSAIKWHQKKNLLKQKH